MAAIAGDDTGTVPVPVTVAVAGNGTATVGGTCTGGADSGTEAAIGRGEGHLDVDLDLDLNGEWVDALWNGTWSGGGELASGELGSDALAALDADPHDGANAALRQVIQHLELSGVVTAPQTVLEERLRALRATASKECAEATYSVAVFFHCTDEDSGHNIVRHGFSSSARRRHGALFSDGCDPSWVYGAPVLSSVRRYGESVVLCVGIMRHTLRVMGKQPPDYLRRLQQAGSGVDTVVAHVHPACFTQLVFQPDHVVPVACGTPDAFSFMDSKLVSPGGDLATCIVAWLNVPDPFSADLLTFAPAGHEFHNNLPEALTRVQAEMTVEAYDFADAARYSFRNLGTTGAVPDGVRARGSVNMYALLEEGRVVFHALLMSPELHRTGFVSLLDRHATVTDLRPFLLKPEANPRVVTHRFSTVSAGSAAAGNVHRARGGAAKAQGQAAHAPSQASHAQGQVSHAHGQVHHAQGQAPQTPKAQGRVQPAHGQAPQAQGQVQQAQGQADAPSSAGGGQALGSGVTAPAFVQAAAQGLILTFGGMPEAGAAGARNRRPDLQFSKYTELLRAAEDTCPDFAYKEFVLACIESWRGLQLHACGLRPTVPCTRVKLMLPPCWNAAVRTCGPPTVAQLYRMGLRSKRMVAKYAAVAKFPTWARVHVARCLDHWLEYRQLAARELLHLHRSARPVPPVPEPVLGGGTPSTAPSVPADAVAPRSPARTDAPPVVPARVAAASSTLAVPALAVVVKRKAADMST